MKKAITVSGKLQTVTGYVVIKMNSRRETISVHNRITHDEEDRQRIYHAVQAEIEGRIVESRETHNEVHLPHLAKEIEHKLFKTLTEIANVEPEKTTYQQLKEMGYE